MKMSRANTCRAAALLGLAALSLVTVPTVSAQSPAHAEHAAPVERLGIPGPIRFGDASYALSWTSHPSADLFKQEYLPKGQDAERYTSMVMIDLHPAGGRAVLAATAMVETLKARKAADPVVNYDLLFKEDGSGALLDFVLSDQSASGVILEWNAYRYTNTPDGLGWQMVGISRRAYGDAAARALLTGLKESRARDIDMLAKLVLPAATPSKP